MQPSLMSVCILVTTCRCALCICVDEKLTRCHRRSPGALDLNSESGLALHHRLLVTLMILERCWAWGIEIKGATSLDSEGQKRWVVGPKDFCRRQTRIDAHDGFDTGSVLGVIHYRPPRNTVHAMCPQLWI